jgi:dihydrofolate synthase/folylpolyglutamate synthase
LNYQQAIDFLYHQYPAFEKQGGMAYKPGLDNVSALAVAFDNPHTKFKSIHIAGTNGKGSSSNLLAAVLQEAGYKTGLYTSPHIHNFTERIRVNGQQIPEEEVTSFIANNNDIFKQYHPSFFEITTVLAFHWFALQHVDIAIIETGMGGKLDATNIIQPELCLITNVSFDHTQYLGTTLLQIAAEKAGIIKKQTLVVLSEYQEETFPVFQKKAEEMQASIVRAYEEYKLTNIRFEQSYLVSNVYQKEKLLLEDLYCGLLGSYQLKNIPGVLAVLDQLKKQGWNIQNTSIYKGFKDVVHLTGFKGRWQVLSHSPLVICDAAHNIAGISYSVQQLRAMHKSIHIVIGMVKDKDIQNVLTLLPVEASYYFCEADSPRALSAEALCEKAGENGLKGIVIKDVNQALKVAMKNASPDDVIWVGGSLYVLGELEVV